MSFIFKDKNFLNLIYKMAQEENVSPGQVQQLPEEIVDKFFENLKQQKESSKFQSISGSSVADRASADQAAFDQPSVKDLANLRSFIPFCQKANVSISGSAIISTTLPQGQGEGWKPYPAKNPQFYINVPGLSLYLEFLKTSKDYKTNRVYIYMLGELIREANKEFGSNVSTLEDEVIVELKTPVDISKDLEANKGTIQLKVGDLRGFDDWYKKNRMSVTNNNAAVQQEKDAKCALLGYVYSKITNSNHKQALITLGKSIGCPTDSWQQLSAQPITPSKSDTPAPTAPAPGQGLSDEGARALQRLLQILAGDGPFKKDELFIGYSKGELETDSLVSFANNSEKYFFALKEKFKNDPGLYSYYSSLEALSDKSSNLIWSLYTATQANLLRPNQAINVGSLNASNFDFLIQNGKVGMQTLLSLVGEICKLNDLKNYSTQRYNHSGSLHVVNSVSFANRNQLR